MVPWDALKYGPVTIAAFTAFWVAGLLTIELRRRQVRKTARSILTNFMIFCFVLTALSWGLTIFDEYSKRRMAADQDALLQAAQRKYDDKLSNIRELIGRLDVETINKLRAENNPDGIQVGTLRTITRSLCMIVGDIYREAGGLVQTNSCRTARFRYDAE
jgi:hypothetical protein